MKRLFMITVASLIVGSPLISAQAWAWTWQATTQIPQNNVFCLLEASDGYLYAGTYQDGEVYRTNDGGTTWTQTAPLGEGGVFALLEDSEGNIYAGTAWNGYVYRTNNGGTTWDQLTGLSGASAVEDLIETSDGYLYAGTYQGSHVYRSNDAGNTWEARSGIPSTVKCLLEASDGYIYAGTGGGAGEGNVYRTNDGGGTWTYVGISENIVNDLIEASDGYIYAITGDQPGKVYKSSDGTGWTETTGDLGATLSAYGLLEASDGYIYANIGPNGVRRTNDGGASWADTGLPKNAWMDPCIETSDRYLYVPTGESLSYSYAYKSSEPIFESLLTWTPTGDLSGAIEVYSLAEEGGAIYAGTSGNGDVFKTTDGGTTWANTADLSGASTVYCLLGASDGSIYAGTFQGTASKNVFKSTDGGTTWTQCSLANPEVHALIVASDGTIYAGTQFANVYESTDGGITWTYLTSFSDSKVYALFEASDGAIYAGTYNDGHVYKSTDGGATWNDMGMLVSYAVEAFCEHPAGTIYAATSNNGQVFKTTDGGASWTEAGDFGGDWTHVYDIVATGDGRIIASTSVGNGNVYDTTDGGSTWAETSPDSSAMYSRSLLAASDGAVYVGTGINGDVFKSGGPLPSALNGTYTLGGGEDYTSFSDAVSALETYGVDGSVTFLVSGGTYSEQVSIGSITGASSSNYIRFQEATGENVTIDGGSSTAITISGGSYIEFWGFNVTTTATGVSISGDASDNNMIKQCAIDAGSTAINIYEGDNNIIQGNQIIDSRITISQRANSNTINNNELDGGGVVTSGIYMYEGCDDNIISNNTIHNCTRGIYIESQTDATHQDDNVIFNNMIYDCALGIFEAHINPGSGYNNNTLFYYNSILASSGFYAYLSNSPDIRNNIFSSAGTQPEYAIWLYDCTGVTSNYNDLWAPYGYIGRWASSSYSTLATWRTASGGDANSISKSPHFASTTDLHINSSSQCIEAGVVISGSQYQYDFDGEVRDGYSKRGTLPDIGADENPGTTPLFVDFVLFDAQALGRDVQITWTTAEEIEAAGFYLWRSDGAGEYEKITVDPIPAQGGPLFGADYTYVDQDLMIGQTYEYRLEAVNIYGQSQYEGPVSVTVGALCGAMVPDATGYVLFALAFLLAPALIVTAVKKR